MKITCFCESEVEIDVPEVEDLNANPQLYSTIMEGDYQSVICPSCGKLLKPELTTRFVDSSCGIDLLFLPEKQRSSFLMGKVECHQPRVVIGYLELVEKLKLYRKGLDDRVVETIKLFMLQKCESDDVKIYYDRTEDSSLVFHLIGLRDDEIAVSKISMEIYEKTLSSLEERINSEESSFLYSPPYVSINKVSPEREVN